MVESEPNCMSSKVTKCNNGENNRTNNPEKFDVRANIKRARCEYQLQLMVQVVGEVACKFHGRRPQLTCFKAIILFIPSQHIFCLHNFTFNLCNAKKEEVILKNGCYAFQVFSTLHCIRGSKW